MSNYGESGEEYLINTQQMAPVDCCENTNYYKREKRKVMLTTDNSKNIPGKMSH